MALILTVLAALALPLGGVFTELASAQQTRSVTWDSIDVTLNVQPDGVLGVTERDAIIFRGGPFQTGLPRDPNDAGRGRAEYHRRRGGQ
jgi:hypothetical protein